MRFRIAPLSDGTLEVDVKLLPDGRTLIHWLRECDDGPITVQGHPKLREVMGRQAAGKYTVACRPQQTTVDSQKIGSVRYLCVTSGDPAAVTCPNCLATPEAVAALATEPLEGAAALQMTAIKGV